MYKLFDAQQTFMGLLASKFMKPSIVQEQKKNGSISSLDTSLDNQRDDLCLGIGPSTRKRVK